MSYHTRKVVQPARPKVDGLPLAFLRIMEMLADTHDSGVVIDAPKESNNGCKFQVGFWATPGALLTIGTPGKPNSMVATVDDGVTTVTITGNRHSETVTAPFSGEIMGDCSIPLHYVYISVYDNWYTFGIAIGDEKKELANKKFGGGLSLSNRIFIHGQLLNYNNNCHGVQVWCSEFEDEGVTYLDTSNYTFSIFDRVRIACMFGEVWEDWAPNGPSSFGGDWPYVAHNKGLTYQESVASRRRNKKYTHDNNVFHWQRPEGARAVYMWLCSSGGGGDGGSGRNGIAVIGSRANPGKPGVGRMFKVDKTELTLRIYPGGEGGLGDLWAGHPGTPGKHTIAEEIPNGTSDGGTVETIASIIGFKTVIRIWPGTITWGKIGAKGIMFGHLPYGMANGNYWRYCGGGIGGTNSDDSFGGNGSPGQSGLALFHYQF